MNFFKWYVVAEPFFAPVWFSRHPTQRGAIAAARVWNARNRQFTARAEVWSVERVAQEKILRHGAEYVKVVE